MAPSFVLDEHLRREPWRAIQQWNAQGVDPVDAVRVGDPPDLPLGTLDPDLLAWAEREGRILVSRDMDTLIGYLLDHLRAGDHSPGLFILRRRTPVSEILDFLVLVTRDSDAADWQDQVHYIP